MSDTRSAVAVVFAAVVLIGCAPQYAYVPTTNATATMQGKAAASYTIPPGAPEGNVRIASYGMADVTLGRTPNESARALHLRMVFTDDGSTPWTFDTRAQRVQLNDGEVLAPAFAAANAGSRPPLVTVDVSHQRTVDLFFLLPPSLRHAKAIPEFDALWTVSAGAVNVTERTPFERLALEPDYGAYDDWDYGSDYYWGAPYWANPEFASDAFGGGVAIRRAPHGGGGARWGGGGGFHGGGTGGGGRAGGHR